MNMWVAESSRTNRKVNTSVLGHNLMDKRLMWLKQSEQSGK